MFEDIQKNGMGAMMKYWNDPNMLAKLGQKIGDVPQVAPQAPAEPEINDLLDAARCACALRLVPAPPAGILLDLGACVPPVNGCAAP